MTVTCTAATRPSVTLAPDLGPATELACRECGATTPLGPFYACGECFGPLEVAYDFAPHRSPARRSRPGRSNIWRYAACCRCRPRRATSRTSSPG